MKPSRMAFAVLTSALIGLTATTHLVAQPVQIAPAQIVPRFAVVPNLNSGDVSILDTISNTEAARIPVGTRPEEVAMSRDGRFAYVSTDGAAFGQLRIVKISLINQTVINTITINGNSALVELEISPNGRVLAAAEIRSGTLYLINAGTMTLQSTTVLCPSCGGGNPIFAAPRVHFSNNSQQLYAALPVETALQVVATSNGAILNTLPGPPNFGSPYGDIKVLQPFDQFVWVSHPQNQFVRLYDVINGVFSDIALTFNSPSDIELIQGSNLLVAGSIQSDPQADFLEVFDLNTATTTLIPSNEEQRQLTFNPQLDELWTTCIFSCGGGNRIEAFDLATLTPLASITMPASAFVGTFPSFSPNGRFYYQPQSNNTVLVVNAVTKAIVTQIPVGSNPRGVYMQGASQPKE